MTPPTVYLIRRGLTDAQIESLREYLRITPLEAVLVTDLGDIEYARKISDLHVSALTRPIAVIGDFEQDFAELGAKTKWQTLR